MRKENTIIAGVSFTVLLLLSFNVDSRLRSALHLAPALSELFKLLSVIINSAICPRIIARIIDRNKNRKSKSAHKSNWTNVSVKCMNI